MNHDLSDELGTAASNIEVPAGDVIEVMTRSRRRSRRRQRVVALGVAVMVLAGATTIVRVANSRDETSVATDGMAVQLGDSGIAWSSQDPAAALSMFQPDTGTATPSGALYELSTAPGEARPEDAHPRVVWRSEDGVDWSPLGRPDDLYLSDLSARGDRLYAVGTGPAAARTTGGDEVPGLLVGWSDDGAGTWRTAPLGIDVAGIASRSQFVSIGPSQVAAGPAGVVAATSVWADLDVTTVLPAGVSAADGWAVGPAGVDLLGPAPGACPAGTTPPEEKVLRADGSETSTTVAPVGADGAPVPSSAVEEPEGRVWSSVCTGADGNEVEVTPQELRGVVDSYTWEQLDIGGDLLQAILGQPFVFHAGPDTETFERVDPGLPTALAGTLVLDVRDDDFLLAAPDMAGGVQVLTSVDGVSWVSSSTLGRMEWVGAAGRVGNRIALLGGDRDGQMVLALGDGTSWQEVDLAAATGLEGQSFFVDAAFGPNGIVAVLGDMAGGRKEDEAPSYHLVASRDGETWSSEVADDVAGGPLANVGSVRATAAGVVVMAVPVQDRVEGEHLRQVALVGTYS